MEVSLQSDTESVTAKETNTLGGQHNCNKCYKMFNSKVDLQHHISIHHPKILNCPECEEKFNENYKLENHMESHTGYQCFQCDECSSKFHLKWRLKKHKMGHQAQFKGKCHILQ